MIASPGEQIPSNDQGFTLIELLVALVAASLLTVMIMNGAGLASRRGDVAETQGTALALAAAQMETAIAARRPGREATGPESGTAGPLHWAIRQQVLMDDPRGLHQLIELTVEVTGDDDRLLTRLSRRLLIRTPEP